MGRPMPSRRDGSYKTRYGIREDFDVAPVEKSSGDFYLACSPAHRPKRSVGPAVVRDLAALPHLFGFFSSIDENPKQWLSFCV